MSQEISLSLASSKEKEDLLNRNKGNGVGFLPWNLPTMHLQATVPMKMAGTEMPWKYVGAKENEWTWQLKATAS